jgi:hypothetical protein
MNGKINIRFLLSDTRARVYLLWAVLATGGFIATHYHQRQSINAVWFIISVIGLGYMYKVMPLKIRQMRHIFLAWAVPIIFGMIISGLVFRTSSDVATNVIVHLGGFWLLVMSVGYVLNGLVDRPAGWYWLAGGVNLLAGILCFTVDSFVAVQYLIAAVVSGWSMLSLWLFRT